MTSIDLINLGLIKLSKFNYQIEPSKLIELTYLKDLIDAQLGK